MTLADNVINRGTSNVLLPKDVSNEIWAKTIEESAVMQLSRRISLPGAGLEFQTITGEPVADWVDETAEKPVSKHEFGTKAMTGYTMAVILPFSNQFRRDKERLYEEMVARAPKALGVKLDKTVFGGDPAPGALFDTMANVQSVSLATAGSMWKALVTADSLVSAADGIVDGWAISPQMKSELLTATDTTSRPLFIDGFNANSVPSLMGHQTYVKKGVYKAGSPNQLGFAGDWTSAMYGVVEDISTSITDQATIKIGDEMISLWQRNMFAVRFEFCVGFRLKDDAHFVKITA